LKMRIYFSHPNSSTIRTEKPEVARFFSAACHLRQMG
jgi:hypothetical protein